ncbi:nitrogen-specific signal transduction histidine kinase [Paenibacillus phyllosphaerae]|uniref:histidine kinase n=1 Tax=Paenibacillus phyllosphaerae TaxID=274593 RepID=A0A7W5AZW3_9BACL|nr:HAMP domain-containing sensor histidine kinase [Paenibacillus phyllosphaerae]MBB3111519.1 nitrogen-specific signal transduction histidine kinase [Paenibacillus phyllosphaerae]
MFIFFMFILFIAIAVFCLTQQKYTKATLFMLLMGFAYLIVVSCIMTYMAKDAYYYNSMDDYFGIKQSLQNQLMFLPISRFTLIRIFNLSTLLFLYAGLCSAVYFAFHLTAKGGRRLLVWLAVPCAVQLILYDPFVYAQLYYGLYPDYMTSQGVVSAYEAIHTVTFVVNTLYVAAGILLLLYALYDAPKVRQIRSNIMMIAIAYISVHITYFYMNYWAPDMLIKVSEAAHFIRFQPINLVGNPSIYTLLPYIAGLCLLVSLYGIYKYARIQNSIRNQEAVISHNIDSALLTSRVFSHYIKNELLAIKAQSEYLAHVVEDAMGEKSPEVIEEIRVIEQRCNNVYHRLDAIHQKNLKSKIELIPVPIYELIDKLLGEMSMELKPIQVRYAKQPRQLVIMADPYYFAQALEHILRNAVDALESVPERSRQIEIDVHLKHKWLELVIADNGKGIAEENLPQIFQPFYSSKPTATNWGMGLSITHTIITAHGGKIHVTSKQGEGTAFHIVMPLLSADKEER